MEKYFPTFSKWLSNDVVVRALKTFVQAFVAVWLVADAPFSVDVLSGAAAAGVSAVWNWYLNRSK